MTTPCSPRWLSSQKTDLTVVVLPLLRSTIYTVATDHTACIWDAEVGRGSPSSLPPSPPFPAAAEPLVSCRDTTTPLLYSTLHHKPCLPLPSCILLAQAGARIRKLKGHKDYINSVAAPRQDKPLFVTGGDDRTVRLWDARRRGHVALLESKYQVTAVSFNGDVDEVISGGLDNDVKIWDLRKNEVVHRLKGHTGEAAKIYGAALCFSPAL